MRGIFLIKLRRSCQVFQSKFSKPNASGEHFRSQLNCSLRQSMPYWHTTQCTYIQRRRFIIDVGIDARYSGCCRRLLQGTRHFMASAESWRVRNIDRRTVKGWGTGGECMKYWTRIQRLLQPMLLSHRKQSMSHVRHTSLPWRPAILVTLADNKGQLVLKLLALVLGGAYFSAVTIPVAEQLDKCMTMNSVNPERLSLCGRLAALLDMTVESMSLLLRTIYLLGLFMPCLSLAPFADSFGGQLRVYWLELLLATLELAGPAFIKWGQWAATRPDIFPEDVCDSLTKLHMKAPSHSFQETRIICEKALKVPLEDIFEEFAEDPVASGSIAQVHRAVLKGCGTVGTKPQYVAVKVRHPGVSKIIQRDFVIIKWLASVSTVLPGLQHLQLDKSVQQFASFMTKQVDLTLEAAHLLRFIYNFRKVRDVSFPTPIYPWVHPTVLVETYEEGQSIANFVNFRTVLTSTHSQLAYIGSSALLKMLLKDNFIHGDLHPGNILVRFNGCRPKVILLDVGMTAELCQRSRDILLELFKAVAQKDGRRVAKWTLQFSKDQSCPDPEGFMRDVDAKFKEYLMVRGTAQNTGECMTQLFDQVRRHRVNIDGDVCTVMVTTMILEGWQRKLDPDLDLIQMLGDLLFKQEWATPYEYTLSAIAAP